MLRLPNPANVPPGYTLDPAPWLEKYRGDDDGPGDVDGLYHVTTRSTRVREAGALRSRGELRSAGIVGLGGGYKNEAPDAVSFVWQLERARWLAGAMRVAALAARDEISAVAVVRAVFAWADYPNGEPWGPWIDSLWEDQLTEGELETALRPHAENLFGEIITGDLGLSLGYAAQDWGDLYSTAGIADWLARNASTIEENHPSGRAKYRLLQQIELALTEWAERHVFDWNDLYCVPLVGFTAEHARFKETLPSEIAIVQAAVRIGAREQDLVPRECELRFLPRDVVIVATNVAGHGA
jgi:hypothetical protein